MEKGINNVPNVLTCEIQTKILAQVIKEKYPGAVSSQPTKKSNGPSNSKEGKKSGKGKGEKYWQASDYISYWRSSFWGCIIANPRFDTTAQFDF